MLIIRKVIKTKSADLKRVKHIVYIIAKTMKQAKMKTLFIQFPKCERWFSMTTVLSGFGIDAIFFVRSGTRSFPRGSFFFTHSTVSFTIRCK